MPLYNDIGYFKARVFTALGAIPLPGAAVKITSSEDSRPNVAHDLITNASGETAVVSLPAPRKEGSLSPSGEDRYALYDVEAYLEGYQPFSALRVPIFPGILSIQPIGLVPKEKYAPGTRRAETNIIEEEGQNA